MLRACSSGQQRIGDALAGLAVAVGVMGEGHCLVVVGIVEQLAGVFADQVHIGADQFDGAGGHGFGAFGGVAHHQHRFAE